MEIVHKDVNVTITDGAPENCTKLPSPEAAWSRVILKNKKNYGSFGFATSSFSGHTHISTQRNIHLQYNIFPKAFLVTSTATSTQWPRTQSLRTGFAQFCDSLASSCKTVTRAKHCILQNADQKVQNHHCQ